MYTYTNIFRYRCIYIKPYTYKTPAIYIYIHMCFSSLPTRCIIFLSSTSLCSFLRKKSKCYAR